MTHPTGAHPIGLTERTLTALVASSVSGGFFKGIVPAPDYSLTGYANLAASVCGDPMNLRTLFRRS